MIVSPDQTESNELTEGQPWCDLCHKKLREKFAQVIFGENFGEDNGPRNENKFQQMLGVI